MFLCFCLSSLWFVYRNIARFPFFSFPLTWHCFQFMLDIAKISHPLHPDGKVLFVFWEVLLVRLIITLVLSYLFKNCLFLYNLCSFFRWDLYFYMFLWWWLYFHYYCARILIICKTGVVGELFFSAYLYVYYISFIKVPCAYICTSVMYLLLLMGGFLCKKLFLKMSLQVSIW